VKKKIFFIGSCDKGNNLLAKVKLIIKYDDEVILKKPSMRMYVISISFLKKHTFKELKDQGLHLPFYQRSGNNWNITCYTTDTLKTEIERLQTIGITIPDIHKNFGLQDFLAQLV